jgi:hypothetical protein
MPITSYPSSKVAANAIFRTCAPYAFSVIAGKLLSCGDDWHHIKCSRACTNQRRLKILSTVRILCNRSAPAPNVGFLMRICQVGCRVFGATRQQLASSNQKLRSRLSGMSGF